MSAQTQALQKAAQDAFAARMAEKHITPLWTIANRIVLHEPEPKVPPVYWNYQRDVRPYMLEAADVITAAEAHRRVLVLNNPVLKHGATHTLTCAIQLIAFRPRACPLSHGRAPRQRRFGERVPKIELGS